jgi:uncharacterized protein (DUF1330 family)
MSAYVIGDINVTNQGIFAEYAGKVPASSGAYGGKYLVRGPDKCEPAEGDWNPKRFVLAEYKDVDTVKAWYYSDEYKELTKLRQSASTGTLLVAEGVEPADQGRGTGTSGYLIGDIEVTDPDLYSKYAEGVPGTVALYGGGRPNAWWYWNLRAFREPKNGTTPPNTSTLKKSDRALPKVT